MDENVLVSGFNVRGTAPDGYSKTHGIEMRVQPLHRCPSANRLPRPVRERMKEPEERIYSHGAARRHPKGREESLKTRVSLILTGVALAAFAAFFALTACQPQTQTAPGGITAAEAHAICSTYAVARNTPDFNMLDQIMAPDIKLQDPFFDEPMTSLEQIKGFWMGTQSAFPDLSMRYDNLIVSGDQIVAEWTMTGTHKGQFGAMPPTNKGMSLSGATIMKVKDGKIVEMRGYFDLFRAFQKMGLKFEIPEAAEGT